MAQYPAKLCCAIIVFGICSYAMATEMDDGVRTALGILLGIFLAAGVDNQAHLIPAEN